MGGRVHPLPYKLALSFRGEENACGTHNTAAVGERERAHLGRTEWVIPITRSLFLPAFWWRLRRSKKTNFHPEDPFAQAALTRPAEESGGTCLLAYVREGRGGKGKRRRRGKERRPRRKRERRSYRLPIMTGGKRGKGEGCKAPSLFSAPLFQFRPLRDFFFFVEGLLPFARGGQCRAYLPPGKSLRWRN